MCFQASSGCFKICDWKEPYHAMLRISQAGKREKNRDAREFLALLGELASQDIEDFVDDRLEN